MSGPSDINIPLYDSESALSRDSLDVGNDSVSSLHSTGSLAPAASQSAPNSAHNGSPADLQPPNAGQYGQVTSPTIAGLDTSSQKKPKAKISWWWWWEIGGALLSIICVGLVLVVLLKANGLALAAWPLWIQPNSLIAVFTTVGKSAMMVPIASCISQLKWRHFWLRTNRLSDLQLLDEASRGPWGSLMLLSDVRTQAYTARALALVSLVSLGFGPSTQQILEFPTRDIRLTNVSASVGVASSYDSKAFNQNTSVAPGSGWPAFSPQWNQDLFKLQSSIIDGISGSVFQPAYSCPGEWCFWPNFTTLGVCGDFLNVTDTVKVNCVGRFDKGQDCSYQFPIDGLNHHNLPPYVVNVSYYAQGYKNEPTSIFASRGVHGPVSGTHGLLLTIKMINDTRASPYDPPQTEAYYSTWYWCERSYHNVTGDPGKINDADFTSEMLSSVVPSEVTTLDGTGGPSSPFVANSTGNVFNISVQADVELFPYLNKLLTRDVVDRWPHAANSHDADSLDLSTFLYTTDLKSFTENLANTLTNQIRSMAPGDNTNAKVFGGDAFVKEVYIRVTWSWLIIPLAETLITAVLLVYCILLSMNHRLLKASLIALLVYGLDGWGADEIVLPTSEDAEKLELMAEGMRARLLEDGDGRPRFFKA